MATRRTRQSRPIQRITAIVLGAGSLAWVASAAVAAPAAPAASGSTPAAAAVKPLPAGLGGREWATFQSPNKIVALTFDAGANADGVGSILATLRNQHVPATFFLTGDFVRQFPTQSRAIVAAGERVGDHSINHPHFTALTDAQMRDQVLTARNQIIAATGADPWPFFRFPFGDRNAHTISVVNSTGFVPVGWTVDTLGWEGTSSGITVASIVSRVLANAKPGEIVLMHCGSNPDDHSTLDAAALPAVISGLKNRGYSFATLDAMLGYRVLTSNGDVRPYGSASFGSELGRLAAGVTTVGIAPDRGTSGYWVLKSFGGVSAFNAPWLGSLNGKVPAGQRVTGIASGRNNGYLILTSGGGVHGFARPLYGSDAGRLPAGVSAVGLTIDTATGGYWIVRSDGRVDGFNAPALGSLAGSVPAGVQVKGIAAGPSGGYYVLTSDGGVRAFGAASFGSELGRLPAGVTAVAIAIDSATGGYWILKSNGGVSNFNAPWYGSLAWKLSTGQRVTAIAGQ